MFMNIRESYDSAAQIYAEHLANELDRKPLDRHLLLNRFAEEMRGRGTVADLGCGPGHVTRYLHDQGVSVEGIDLSSEMIRVARSLNPGIEFRVGDITSLGARDGAYVGVVLFYSLVHFATSELESVLQEVRRVLEPTALTIIAFHIGDVAVHVDELFGARVSLDFRFFPPSPWTRCSDAPDGTTRAPARAACCSRAVGGRRGRAPSGLRDPAPQGSAPVVAECTNELGLAPLVAMR
jgi:SAM-dependent methyltransferase